jgi:hypothetical protein
MKLIPFSAISLLFITTVSWAAEGVVTAVHGTVTKVDAVTKTIVVKTADGTEHTLHFIKKTSVHGAEVTEAGAKEGYQGLREGYEVVARYTVKGGEKTAVEVDKMGKEGMHEVTGTVSSIDRNGKKLVVKAADGTEQTYRIASHAAGETAEKTEKAAKVTVYYTENAGKKIAHFFEGKKD